jgi:DNA-binding NarL/FixJ family response regulator
VQRHDARLGGAGVHKSRRTVLSGYEPEDRELFERAAIELYDLIVQEGGIAPNDPRLTEGSLHKEALDLLAELSLVQIDTKVGQWRALEPANVQARVVTPLSTEGARLLDESARWAKAFQALGQSWKRSPQPESSAPFTYLHGEAISPYIAALLRDAEEELLTAQPQAGRGGPSLASAALRDIEALERGLTMRTLYQHSARRHAATREYVAEVTARGAEVRTLDEFFNRMIVVDRRVAVIPASEDMKVAVAVHEASVVAYLIDVFDRAFARALPFTNNAARDASGIASEQRAMTIRMLVEGHADAVSAKRLGVSARTYAGYVAELKQMYDVQTRFQLGYRLGRRGVAGKEQPQGDEPG